MQSESGMKLVIQRLGMNYLSTSWRLSESGAIQKNRKV
jgi:hypothetical protein